MNKKIEFIGWLSETRDPITFTKDGGSRFIIELPENEGIASFNLSTMRKHKIKFTAECLPNNHEKKDKFEFDKTYLTNHEKEKSRKSKLE